MASSNKLSVQDRKDLDKFTKLLALKAIQVIVQARLGEKIRTKSKTFSSGADWYNLVITDMPEVLSESKKALGGKLPSLGNPLCIEISLRTVEGDIMVLENWCLGMTEERDPNARITYAVYNRMGLLLKSIFAVSRVTPAYKLSRQQGIDSYVICYRLYFGDPNLRVLGEAFQVKKIGAVGTPVATFIFTLAYRTKMTLTPQKCDKEMMLVKDDHFRPDCSPKRSPRPCQMGFHTESRGNVADEIAEALSQCEDCNTLFSTSPNTETGTHHEQGQQLPIERKKSLGNGVVEKQHSFSKLRKVGAFATQTLVHPDISEYILPESPLTNLLQNGNVTKMEVKYETGTKSLKNTDRLDNNCNLDDALSDKSTDSRHSLPDDFVMVDLKAPFSVPDAQNELTAFIRECQAAPTLPSLNSPEMCPEMDDIVNQLDAYEMNADAFDEFVNNLAQVEGPSS